MKEVNNKDIQGKMGKGGVKSFTPEIWVSFN